MVAEFAAYFERPGNGAWGSLHIVLGDGNTQDAMVASCAADAAERGDGEGGRLAAVLLRMSRTQRARLPSKVDAYIRSRRNLSS